MPAADIPEKHKHGRTIDIHALRHTFGTVLSNSGVAPRTAQVAMHRPCLDPIMNVYTDPTLLDVAGVMGQPCLDTVPLER